MCWLGECCGGIEKRDLVTVVLLSGGIETFSDASTSGTTSESPGNMC
jgi:hypothetical protein